jgi:uncharacterized membrane protein YccC
VSRRAATLLSVVLVLGGLALLLHGVATVLGRGAAELVGAAVSLYAGFVAATVASPLPARRVARPRRREPLRKVS